MYSGVESRRETNQTACLVKRCSLYPHKYQATEKYPNQYTNSHKSWRFQRVT